MYRKKTCLVGGLLSAGTLGFDGAGGKPRAAEPGETYHWPPSGEGVCPGLWLHSEEHDWSEEGFLRPLEILVQGRKVGSLDESSDANT